MRRRIAVLASFALIAMLATGSIAYFTKTQVSENVITAGNIDIRICQTLSPEEDMYIMPGDTKRMVFQAENTGEHPAFVRMEIRPGEEGIMEFDINEEYWTYQDGYYYYNKELKAGEKSEPLFTEVYFDGEKLDNGYIGKGVKLDVLLYAVQSENNGSQPLKAAGWPKEEVR